MSSFDQLPKSNSDEPSVDTPMAPGAFEPPPGADVNAAPLPERVAAARLRFMALTSRYLALSNRSKEAMKRSRESLEQHKVDRDALCASGARYALLLRALGEPPERALISIKTAFTEAAPVEGVDNRETLEAVVKSIVMAYYAA